MFEEASPMDDTGTPVTICEEQIHYPDEDYPCLCEELRVDPSGERCVQCGHLATKHTIARTQ
jgi:hypothetical protein